MSRSDWIKFAKIVGLASGAFTLALLIYLAGYRIGNVSGHYDSQAYSAAEQYPSDTQRIIDDCFKLPTRAATSECVSKTTEASHENQRAEQDLIAQREMSDWGWWALVISGLQFLATIISLGFIKLTLDATLEAVKDTGEATKAMLRQNEIAERGQRPWIKISPVSEIIFDPYNEYGVQFPLHLANFGTVPAIGLSYTPTLFLIESELNDTDILHSCVEIGKWLKGEVSVFPNEAIIEGDSTIFWTKIENIPSKANDIGTQPSYYLLASVYYRMPGGGDVFYTAVFFYLGPQLVKGNAYPARRVGMEFHGSAQDPHALRNPTNDGKGH